jgi:hypothetical protein
MKHEPRNYMLCITSGLHAGANYKMTEGVKVRIGNSLELCDILLLDDGVAPEHLEIIPEYGQLVCRTFASNVTIDGKILAQGQKYFLSINTTFKLGDATICVNSSRLELSRNKDKQIKKIKLLPLVLIITLGGFSAWIYLQPNKKIKENNVENQKKIIERRLLELEIIGKVFVDGDNLFVNGIAKSDAEKIKLEREISSISPPPRFNIKVGSEISDSIEKSFRLSGHNVSTEYKKEGIVIVNGFSGSAAEANRLAITIGQDYPLIRDLKITTKDDLAMAISSITLPPPSGIDFNIMPKSTVDSKRLAAAIDGADAQIIMNDGSRYFPGSVMPSGGTLESINKNGLILKEENKFIQYPH